MCDFHSHSALFCRKFNQAVQNLEVIIAFIENIGTILMAQYRWQMLPGKGKLKKIIQYSLFLHVSKLTPCGVWASDHLEYVDKLDIYIRFLVKRNI